MTGDRYRSTGWYIWDSATNEFLLQANLSDTYVGRKRKNRWTPSIKMARCYKNPTLVQITAIKLRERGFPRAGVVTAEAARCLDEKRRRGEAIP